MLNRSKFSTFFVTLYLIMYTWLTKLEASFDVIIVMFLLSPFLVIWMAYTILKHGKFDGKELQEDEEWGYSDTSRNDYKKA